MALNTVSSDRLSTNVKNTNFTAAEKQDLTDDILPLAGQLGNRNLIINGAMQVAQRGTSSTSSGFYTVDRFQVNFTGTNEAPTQAQVALSSSDTPYSSGFRFAYKVTNGNQTSGGGAGRFIRYKTTIEAQDIAQSGWNYTSSSSNVTLSFWVKASVAQTYFGRLQTYDGTAQNYPFSFALSANTWTKVTKTIPGNSNLQFDNNNAEGLLLEIVPYYGTDYTNGSMSVDAWAAYSDRTPNNTATWYETDDATFEITGIQLEVGSVATDFEHRSFGEELALCQRYYYRVGLSGGNYYGGDIAFGFTDNDDTNIYLRTEFTTQMRIAPTAVEQSGDASEYKVRRDSTKTCSSVPTFSQATAWAAKTNFPSSSHGWGTAQPVWGQTGNADSFLAWSAEL